MRMIFDKHPSFADLTQRSVPVLARDPIDQLLHLAPDPQSARALTRLRAIEFAGDQLAVPGQNRVRPGDGCDRGENFAAQAMTKSTRFNSSVEQIRASDQYFVHASTFSENNFCAHSVPTRRRPSLADWAALPPGVRQASQDVG